MSVATFSFVRMGARARDGRYRFALLLGTLVAFSVYKVWAIGFDRPLELGLSVLFDSSVWLTGWFVCEAIAAIRRPRSERVADALFYTFLYGSGALVFAHAFFFYAAIERRLTALDVTGSGIVAFFREVLPWRGYAALGFLLLIMHAIAWVANAFVQRPRLLRALSVVLPLVVLSSVWSWRAPRTPSVLFDTGKELWDLATLPRLVGEPFARVSQRLSELSKSRPSGALPESRFKKVIVLVMETMTSEQLSRETKQLEAHTFLSTAEAHSHRYARYFPNNQDSRTGMLDMLTSRLIPYEAYSDVGVAGYEKLADEAALPDHFKAMGFQTAFAVSQLELEEVVRDLAWDERLHLSQSDIARAKGNLLCFAPDEYENSCEDLALLPKLVDFVADHERAFVYQEFIWGHASEYNTASGKTNAAYYSTYVDQLIERLRERGLLDQTLLVLTSDHGFRDKGMQAELAVYQIPLLFYASSFSAHSDARLLSHVDFKDLLLSELGGEPELVTPNELVMIVGPTGSGMVTAISEHGDFTLLRRRGDLHMLLARRRVSEHALSPNQLLYLFERYRAGFDRQLHAH